MPDGDAGVVLVVGSVNVDLVVSIERLPGSGETVTGGSFARHPGGKGGNQAVAAARVAARTSFVGAVGDDDLGAAALEDLRAAGVDVSQALTLAGVPTGVALILVARDGENLIAVASGANAALTGPLVEETLTGWQSAAGADGRGVVLTSFEISDEAVLAAALFAHQHGMQLIVNPAPARALPASLVELNPILLPNAVEARSLGGADDAARAARTLAEQTDAPVVVTLGPEGALLVDGEGETRIPAPHVQVVDTTGAGDTFAGVLAAEISRGVELRQAARFAVAAASLSVTVAGARAGMPNRQAVERILRES